MSDLLLERVDDAPAEVVGQVVAGVDELEDGGDVHHVLLEACGAVSIYRGAGTTRLTEVHDDLHEGRALALDPVVEDAHLALGVAQRELRAVVEVVERDLGVVDGELELVVVAIEVGDGLLGGGVVPVQGLAIELKMGEDAVRAEQGRETGIIYVATLAGGHEVLHPIEAFVAGGDSRGQDFHTLLLERRQGLPVGTDDLVDRHA